MAQALVAHGRCTGFTPYQHLGIDDFLAHRARYRYAMMPIADVIGVSHLDQLNRRQGDPAQARRRHDQPATLVVVSKWVEVRVEVIQAVKEDPETRHIPMVAITAHVWDGLAQSAGQVGCDGYISKPYGTKQLVQEIQKYLKTSAA